MVSLTEQVTEHAVQGAKWARLRRVSCVWRCKPTITSTCSAAKLSERWSIRHQMMTHITAPALAAPATRCRL